jgi:hypothetical protein
VYLINYLSLHTAQQLFIAVGRYRTGMGLVGVRNATNHVFHVPGGDTFVHNLPFLTVCVYVNGQRLALLDDYTISESGGPGTGYDTVVLTEAPYLDDHVGADYVVP